MPVRKLAASGPFHREAPRGFRLSDVEVRPATPGGRPLWDALMDARQTRRQRPDEPGRGIGDIERCAPKMKSVTQAGGKQLRSPLRNLVELTRQPVKNSGFWNCRHIRHPALRHRCSPSFFSPARNIPHSIQTRCSACHFSSTPQLSFPNRKTDPARFHPPDNSP